MVPAVVLTQSKPVPITAIRPVSIAVPKISVARPRHVKLVVTKPNSIPKRHINRSPSPRSSNSPPRVTAVKALGNPQHALKDKGVIDSGCSRHITGNMCYLSDFKELNGRYVAFGGNPKGDTYQFTWVFFLATKDETGPILNTFITGLKNQLSLKVKVIKSDNGTEFKNHDFNQFCGIKGIKREFSVPKTPQQNGIAERKNMTHIKAARTILADLLLPVPFWDEAFNSACYVQNKVDEGFLVGYSVSSKAFRVFNSRTRIVQETLHVNFLKNKPNVAGSGPTWLFDIDTLTKNMNYQLVTAGNQSNPSAGVQEILNAEKAREEIDQQYVLFPVWSSGSRNPQNTNRDAAFNEKEFEFDEKKHVSEVNVSPSSKFEDLFYNSINEVNADGTLVPTVGKISPNSANTFSAVGPSNAAASPTHGKSLCIDASQLPDDPDMLELEDITYSDDEDDVGAEADFNNLETSITVSPVSTIRVHKDHHVT
nr:hypothetical protein [Tanacetum cinerariifolium]